VGCASKEPVEVSNVQKVQEVQKLEHISQNVDVYLANFVDNNASVDQEEFEKHYFSAWDTDTKEFTVDRVQWAFEAFKYGDSYGENLQLIEEDFFTSVKENANYKEYAKINKNALSLYELNIRAFPSDRPLLRDPSKAGEGFPFDYLQNTSIHANKPLFVTHYSKDKAWAHVFSSFAYGWVKTREIVLLEDSQTKLWRNAQQIFIKNENVPIYTQDGEFLFKTKLGMMFALIDEDEQSYTVLAISNYKQNKALFLQVKLSKAIAHKGALTFNKKNIAHITQEILHNNYGWGGIYGQRDCSSTLRDFFAPFGIWLPRNSYKQSKVGKVVSLVALSDDEKRKKIKENAQAFKTLLYKKGHIVLYTGIVDGKITVLQNMWGIKTKKDSKEGRYLVGKTVFSTLDLGSELLDYDQNASLIQNLQSMNTLID
jgi:cell wall-associated NlpC family hydrolase